MFQNLGEQTIENVTPKMKNRKINMLANIFAKEYIILYVISFMTSMVGLTGEVSPFSLSMIAACFSNSIPLLGIVVVSLVGNAIKFGAEGALSYLLTVLVMIATLFMLKPKYNEEERNEKIQVGKNIFIATLVVQFAKSFMATFTIYDGLVNITFAIIVYVFYKIFVNSMVAVENFQEKKAFSIEEVIGTSLLLAIAVSCFGDFAIVGFSIRNVISIFIVLVLGWKNGILVGTTSGVTIGVTLGIIAQTEPIMIAAYAISGMIAGILNRFGKIGVIVGFALGNIVLAYISNGYTVELIHFKEILLASVALLALPKNISFDVEEFMGGSKFLPLGRERTLQNTKQTAEKLNHVSQTIAQIATQYQGDNTIDEKAKREENKQIFMTELLAELEPYQDNLLYEDISNTQGKIVDKIFQYLLDNQEMNREALLKIFADCNSYIVGFDDKEVSQYLEENINQIIMAINTAYKISKSNFVWQKKMEENKKTMESQLKGVSKAISGIAKEIEQDGNDPSQYTKQEKEIIAILQQKEIEVEDLAIRKEGRYFIDIYTKPKIDIAFAEQILTKILKEPIIWNEEASQGERMSFLSDDKFVLGIGIAESYKSQNIVSGDSMLHIRLKDGKYLVALSDGMGTGKQANESSTKALELLENLLLSGFDKSTSVELITSSLIQQNAEMFATLDIAIIDLYQGTIEMMKSGACPTYIKHNKKVQLIKSASLPAGIVEQNNLQVFDRDIEAGEILLMCTDGILDSNIEYKNKELWVKYLLEDIETNNTKKIADLVLNEAIDNNFGKAKDDMSVIVCKFLEKDEK